MFRNVLAAALAFACLAVAPSAAFADNMTARDAGNVVKTMCTKTQGGVEHACHLNEALNPSGVPTPLNITAGGDLKVTGLTIDQIVDLSLATAANQVALNAKIDTLIAALSSPATAANQATGNTSLSSIDTKLSGQATAALQGTANTKLDSVISALASPLTVTMSGSATAALQGTGNTSLSSIDTKLSSQATAALQGTTNTKLDSVISALGTLATASAQTTAAGKLDTLHTDLTAPTPAGNNAIGDVGSASFSATCTTLTLPGTGGTFASGDLVANSASAGSVVPFSCVIARYSGGPITVTRSRILTSTTGVTNANFREHFYTSAPTVTNGNDGVFLSTASGHFCRIDVTVDQAFSDGADGVGVPVTGSACTRVLTANNTVYGLLEARAAYAWTAAMTFTITLEGYN